MKELRQYPEIYKYFLSTQTTSHVFYNKSDKCGMKNPEISKSDIVLFRSNDNQNSTELKNFLRALAFLGYERPYRFSYVERDGALIEKMTLKENILLDSIPNTLCTSKEFQLSEYLTKTGNVHLMGLFNQIKNLDKYPGETEDNKRKLTALMKGLIPKTKFLFLDQPEKGLEEFQIKLLLKAVSYQAKNQNKIVFVRPLHEQLWNNHITKELIREKTGTFKVTKFANHQIREKFLEGRKTTEGYLKFIQYKYNKNSAA